METEAAARIGQQASLLCMMATLRKKFEEEAIRLYIILHEAPRCPPAGPAWARGRLADWLLVAAWALGRPQAQAGPPRQQWVLRCQREWRSELRWEHLHGTGLN